MVEDCLTPVWAVVVVMVLVLVEVALLDVAVVVGLADTTAGTMELWQRWWRW
jgi:hypothetical protein